MGVLRIEDLVKRYGKRTVVNSVSLHLQQGEIVGLLGPNGAGKTTTFSMICGIIPVNGGRILLDETDITRAPMYKRARYGIGYLAQNTSIFRKLTVEQNVMAILETLRIGRAERKERLEFVLEELGIGRLRRSKAYTLSGGERRRTEIARALVTRPRFLLLDEPFSGVDPKAVEELQQVIEQLREQGLGLLITDHSVRETLSVTDRSYVISNGEILASGAAGDLINNPAVRKVYLGEKFYMQGHDGPADDSDGGEASEEEQSDTARAGL
ncbi:MAG: Lipopolysaccharide export system ATP-binding protein LptB [candidate division BRC1 bacterium ADurb.BinA364]|nr:MAG: Lipopolysaccharide export system ATP-binding protein LptB [candidate division BRC1 bacterium ADurb.BinA364]